MYIAAIIIGMVIIFTIGVLSHISTISTTAKFKDGIAGGIIISILLIIEIDIVSDILKSNNPKPTPMDVYKGNTTLEYKVIDNIKVDSCVVFKNNKNYIYR